jgi:two-component system chemotaxis response regulator CheV
VSEAGGERPSLVFSLGQELFGVRLESVREISEASRIAPVPRAPDLIRGLADVRGRMTTVIDLPALVGAPRDHASRGRLMILAEPRDYLALWTSSEINLLELEPERGPSADEAWQDVCEGTAGREGQQVHLLSTERILLACEKQVLRRYQTL